MTGGMIGAGREGHGELPDGTVVRVNPWPLVGPRNLSNVMVPGERPTSSRTFTMSVLSNESTDGEPNRRASGIGELAATGVAAAWPRLL